MKVQKSSEQFHRQLKSRKTGEEYSLSCVISDALCSSDIFLSHEIIKPNARSSAPHFHTETDEIIHVLNGELKAVEGDLEILVRKGDSVLFEKKSDRHHFLINESNINAQVLVIRKKTETIDVVFLNR